MLAENTDSSLSSTGDFMAPEIDNVGLFDLREDGEGVVWFQIGVRWQGMLTLHLVVRIVESGVQPFQLGLAFDLVEMLGFGRT